jgi:hypothetical protein
MASIEYSLFRAKFIKSSQPSLFYADLIPQQLFMLAIQEKPSAELRRGHHWHIGNTRLFSEHSGYFAIGRTTKATIEKFDETSGNFREEELDTSPYTHCVFNAQIGIIGIARKASLAPTVKGIADRIQQVLSRAPTITQSNTIVEVSPIPDPQGFLLALETAYRVPRFSATFHGRNPFDSDEYFQKPLAVYLTAANGKSGKAQIQGDDLNRDVLQSVTRSTAATGNEASATIVRNESQKAITIHLKGDPIKRTYDLEEHQPESILEDLEKLYDRVRQNEKG